jgi:hypothetical protein
MYSNLPAICGVSRAGYAFDAPPTDFVLQARLSPGNQTGADVADIPATSSSSPRSASRNDAAPTTSPASTASGTPTSSVVGRSPPPPPPAPAPLMVFLNGRSVPATELLQPGMAAQTLNQLKREHRDIFAMSVGGASGSAAVLGTGSTRDLVPGPGALGILQANAASTLAPPPSDPDLLSSTAFSGPALAAFLRGSGGTLGASRSTGSLRFSSAAGSVSSLEPRVVPRHTGRGTIFASPFGVSLSASSSTLPGVASAEQQQWSRDGLVNSPRRR